MLIKSTLGLVLPQMWALFHRGRQRRVGGGELRVGNVGDDMWDVPGRDPSGGGDSAMRGADELARQAVSVELLTGSAGVELPGVAANEMPRTIRIPQFSGKETCSPTVAMRELGRDLRGRLTLSVTLDP